ncbi:hypothetical protein F4778DRAFT_283404 [Xylariomycetidae sp. FL2044]|nr:hypothetical protein F4778DRAFT_283404 [Xylariomycetidae sp. FL2044]
MKLIVRTGKERASLLPMVIAALAQNKLPPSRSKSIPAWKKRRIIDSTENWQWGFLRRSDSPIIPSATTKAVLASRELTISNPQEELQWYVHTFSAAAKLVFFDRGGAERLYDQGRGGSFIVGGHVPHVRPNRVKSKPRDPGPQCRVLHIQGPSEIVNTVSLLAFFHGKFEYQMEGIEDLVKMAGIARQEWRFGSYRRQAETTRQLIIEARELALRGQVRGDASPSSILASSHPLPAESFSAGSTAIQASRLELLFPLPP